MPVIKKSALVRHSAEQMFKLVADVEGYPDFLPWCNSAQLLSATDDEICGRIDIARMGVCQTFAP